MLSNILRRSLSPKISMTNNDLIQTLDSLHQSLAENPEIDEPTAAKIRLLLDEIQLALARSTSVPTATLAHQTLTKRVQDLISDFELQHPKLTSNLSLIAERLADMGI